MARDRGCHASQDKTLLNCFALELMLYIVLLKPYDSFEFGLGFKKDVVHSQL